MRRMALVTNVDIITRELEEHDDIDTLDEKSVPEGVEVYEINANEERIEA